MNKEIEFNHYLVDQMQKGLNLSSVILEIREIVEALYPETADLSPLANIAYRVLLVNLNADITNLQILESQKIPS